jgi:arylsulfatase A-like enzyme
MKRNVLFITADQWRGDCLSALGHPCVKTPHLDALAGAGVLFSSHYCQALPCGPSRASLHTGLYLMNHRSATNGTPLDRRHINWAQLVREAGYDPVLFGYTDTSLDPRDYPPDDPRLTTYEGVLPGMTAKVLVNSGDVAAWASFLASKGYRIPDHPPDVYRMKVDVADWEDGGPVPAPLAIRAEHHDTYFLTDRAIEYIGQHTAEPWCVHLSLLRPHPPWIAPEPYNSRYDPARVPESIRAGSAEEEGAQHPWLAYQLSRNGARAPFDARLKRMKATYFGLMSEVDDNLGRLLAALVAMGEWASTLIVFTSDHGEQLGDHWLLGKAGYFDQSYRVPLIVRDPRRAADATRGAIVDRFTEHVDVMPTLLEWLGLEVPPACDGASLLPFVERTGGPARWRDAAHWEFDFRDAMDSSGELALGLPIHACNLAVLRDHAFKYVHFAALPPLLFDLRNDPHEFRDLAADPGHAAVVRDYAQRMLSWRMRHADQTLTHLRLGSRGPIGEPGARW